MKINYIFKKSNILLIRDFEGNYKKSKRWIVHGGVSSKNNKLKSFSLESSDMRRVDLGGFAVDGFRNVPPDLLPFV